jgi:hypothetical protein
MNFKHFRKKTFNISKIISKTFNFKLVSIQNFFKLATTVCKNNIGSKIACWMDRECQYLVSCIDDEKTDQFLSEKQKD